MPRALKVSIGLAAWLGVAAAALALLLAGRGEGGSTLARVSDFLSARELDVDVELGFPRLVELGDEVYIEGVEAQAGEVVALLDAEGRPLPELWGSTGRARLRLFDGEATPVYGDASARLILVPEALVWVAETLLTEENLPAIAAEWNRTMLLHRDEIFLRLTPIVVAAIRDVEVTVAESLPGFTARHRAEIRRISEKIEATVDDRALAKLFEEEVWPIGEQELRPIADAIGREIWEKVPLWGFTWRILWQSLPLTDDDYFQRKWAEFVTAEIEPIIRAKLDDIVGATKRVGRRMLENERLKSHLRDAVLRLVDLPEFHALVQAFVRETFLDNPRFHQRMLALARSRDVEAALAAASAHVEPTLRRMADLMFGTRQKGITDEFARVLRTQILQLDCRRFVIDPGTEAAGPLPTGKTLRAFAERDGARRRTR